MAGGSLNASGADREPSSPRMAAAQQNSTHDPLVTHVTATPAGPFAPVDAIVVPTVRHFAALRRATGLAGRLNCTLLLLCSGKWSDRREAADLACRAGVSVV